MLRAKLTLTSKIFDSEQGKIEFEKAVAESIKVLLTSIQEYIEKSKPRGRTYRIRMPSGRIKVHTASAKGQPPAILTGDLLASIRTVKLGRWTWRIRVDKEYGEILDAKDGLNRYFFEIKLEEHIKLHGQILEKCLQYLLEPSEHRA